MIGEGPAGDDPESAARHLLGSRASAGPRLTGGDTAGPRLAARDIAAREPAVVVTLGAAGALIVRTGVTAVAVPAPAVHPVDTTGAGDTFNGALAAGLADGLNLDGAVRRAVAAAALSTTRPGARGGMPTRAELDGFLGGT